MSRLVVGVTGGIGSGKTAATDYFAGLGICVVDADLAARVIMQAGGKALAAVEQRFGADILQSDGSLDRARLRQIVFSEPGERAWLEQLTHPLIAEEISAQIAAADSCYVILASPLLLETSQLQLCDIIVVVDVPEDIQLQRAMARDANDEAQIRRIMAAQMARQERLARADEVLDNSGSLSQLQAAVAALHQRLLERAGQPA